MNDSHNQMATQHATNAVVVWLIVGLGTNLITGHLISWSSLLLVFPGIFIASFASVPTYLLKKKKFEVVPHTKSIGVLAVFTITSFVSVLWIPLLAIVAANLLNGSL